MCGVNGIYAYHYAANPIDRDELTRTRDHMASRGPDGKGEWVSSGGRVGLGHRRLSIIDLSDAGAQPMSNSAETMIVTFNGEIYNYKDLRRDLETKGCVFRSNSDTEVLLHLYALKGDSMVNDLRGMFAFAIWDTTRQRLFLARDPYGIKPLYYSDDGWTFRFASQVKALLAGGAIARDLDPGGLVGFYLWGNVPEPYTTYRAIHALPAGSTMCVDSIGGHAPRRYHSIAGTYREGVEKASDYQKASRQEHERIEAISSALRESVRYHLVSDVPVGVFLSAGVDSGALVGLMRDAGHSDIQTVTLSFEEYLGSTHDEAPVAEQIARLYGARHTTRVVTRTEFEAELPCLIDAMDQPTIDGVNTWFVSKTARELGLKVAISGLGGDELLGGYSSFRDIPRWVRQLTLPSIVPGLGRVFRPLARLVAEALGISPKAAGLLELGGSYPGAYLLKRGLFMPWELSDVIDRDIVISGLRRLEPMKLIRQAMTPDPENPFARVAALESSIYMRNQLLRDADWASMAHSLEVRMPLVDHQLLRQVADSTCNLSFGSGKRILGGAPAAPLPSAIVDRPKTGFTTPIERWMQGQGSTPFTGEQSCASGTHWARRWSRTVGALATSGYKQTVS